MGTRTLPGVKRSGCGADHPPPSKHRGHERVELYLYSPSGPSWPVIGGTLPLPLQYISRHVQLLSVCVSKNSKFFPSNMEKRILVQLAVCHKRLAHDDDSLCQ